MTAADAAATAASATAAAAATAASATAAAAAVSSRESSSPSWILLNMYARVGECRNETTANCKGRNDLPILASLVREQPPLPSNLYVCCSGATFGEIPRSLSMVDDLILFHVYIGTSFGVPSPLMSDFFIYRADPKRPSLEMLPHPRGQVSRDDAFGIYPRGEDHYTIAALIPSTFQRNLFSLHLYDSETKIWSWKKLTVERPQSALSVNIPFNFCQILLQHNTSTVVTLGEKIGWVDLWSGIVFCDMLSKKHALTCAPLPLPLKCTKEIAYSSDEQLGDARFHRGIAFTNGCLRLVEVEFDVVVDVPYAYDKETGRPSCRTKNWTITTWTNKEMKNSYAGWHMDCTLQASDIVLGDHSESELPPVDLQYLFVCDPTIGMNEDDSHIIYVTARMKFMHPKSWVLAIDIRDRKVRSVVKSGPPPKEKRFIHANYCACSISKNCSDTSAVSGGTWDAAQSTGQ